jgi:hypothetical protein
MTKIQMLGYSQCLKPMTRAERDVPMRIGAPYQLVDFELKKKHGAALRDFPS